MTIPRSPASDRRGPRETLLALTEAYLRRGELDRGGRHSVAALEGRVRAPVAGMPVPEWAPLAGALAATLRGEAETAVRLVAETLGARAFPEPLKPALLGIGIRAARAADRTALAARWGAGLRVRLQREAQRATETAGSATAAEVDDGPVDDGKADDGKADDGKADDAKVDATADATAGEGDVAEGRASAAARRIARDAVLATLPAPIRELLTAEVYEAGYGAADEVEGFESLALGGDGPDADRPGGLTGDGAQRGAGDGLGAGGEAAAGRGAGGAGGVPPGSDAVLHLVMDAYHGDVVSVPARVEVLVATRGVPVGGAAPGCEARPGATLLTVRVAAGRPLPDPPSATTWHVRFVGRARALDARTSDGSLLDLSWDDGALVATLQPPDWFDELGVEPDVLATRVTHVVVVPETDGAEPA